MRIDIWFGILFLISCDICRCCNTCQSVLDAFQLRGWTINNLAQIRQCTEEGGNLSTIGYEGCRIKGHLGVNKVAGSFHISPGKSYIQGHSHIHFLQGISRQVFQYLFFIQLIVSSLMCYFLRGGWFILKSEIWMKKMY